MPFTARPRHYGGMTLVQFVIVIGVIAGIVVIGLLALIPVFLDLPRGRDKDEPDVPAPTPRRHRDDGPRLTIAA